MSWIVDEFCRTDRSWKKNTTTQIERPDGVLRSSSLPHFKNRLTRTFMAPSPYTAGKRKVPTYRLSFTAVQKEVATAWLGLIVTVVKIPFPAFGNSNSRSSKLLLEKLKARIIPYQTHWTVKYRSNSNDSMGLQVPATWKSNIQNPLRWILQFPAEKYLPVDIPYQWTISFCIFSC